MHDRDMVLLILDYDLDPGGSQKSCDPPNGEGFSPCELSKWLGR